MNLPILDIAAAWSFWDRPVPASIPRSVDLPEALRSSLGLVVQGVRRCGKSTLLRQLVGHYGLDPRDCAFLNLEDPRLSRALTWQTLQALVDRFREARPGRAHTFFLDEIQEVDGWQRWLRSQLDRPAGDTFVITGSNATLLSGELATALTGRHLTVELFPFDLDELRLRDPACTVEDYLHRGGFPEPLELGDGDRLLRQYFIDIVERDIRSRVGARSSLPIRQIAQMAFESAGSELSLRRVAGAAGISADTAALYLQACEAAQLLFGCPFFTWSERKRAARPHKYYPVDPALRRVVVTTGGGDRGKSLECATYVALRKRFERVGYWRGQGEVDFVVASDRTVTPVQVTWDAPRPRHERALEEFYGRFPHAEEAVIVTASTFEEALERLG